LLPLLATALALLVGCRPGPSFSRVPSGSELAQVHYAPLERDDWNVSTPAAQGLDPDLVARLYFHAAESWW
jgi:hypothetical protein